ncbi:MAG: antitoxin Xre/MbcA/ParS toxin-binding domain-containing protein [Acidobacteriota bacterium]
MIKVKTRSRMSEADLLGIRTKSPLGLTQRIESGLPFDSIERVSKKAGLPIDVLRSAVRITPRTMARRRNEGRLSPDESDRLVSVSRLLALAIGLFGGRVESATRWLTAPNRALGRRSPIEAARTEIGTREVENLIGRLEHGVFT